MRVIHLRSQINLFVDKCNCVVFSGTCSAEVKSTSSAQLSGFRGLVDCDVMESDAIANADKESSVQHCVHQTTTIVRKRQSRVYMDLLASL